jgi:hypothetical protein
MMSHALRLPFAAVVETLKGLYREYVLLNPFERPNKDLLFGNRRDRRPPGVEFGIVEKGFHRAVRCAKHVCGNRLEHCFERMLLQPYEPPKSGHEDF